MFPPFRRFFFRRPFVDEPVDNQQYRADADKAVGHVEGGIRPAFAIEQQEIHHFAVSEAVDDVAERTADLLRAMDLTEAAGRTVADYSAGMTKKIALAAALIHAPSVLILDEPFEAVDPVSAANIQDILKGFVGSGGTVVLSSHVMDLVQRLCDHVAIMNEGHILAAGTVSEVRGNTSLEERFVQLVGGRTSSEGLSWLGTSSH